MKPLFSLQFTILLGIVLFIPFFLRGLHSELEPYPAILLPGGASTVNLNKKVIEIHTLTIYGYDIQGNLQRINAKKFLDPIPVHFLYGIADNEFGLSKKTIKKIRLRGLKTEIELKKKYISSESQKIAKLWLSEKLSELGLTTSVLLIRYEIEEIDLNSGEQVLRKVKNEKNILLQ